MAAPAPQLRCWADLPPDVLYEVLRRVPCRTDRGQVALACRPWRASLAHGDAPRAPPAHGDAPRQLPWLLLPPLHADGGFAGVRCVLSGCRVHLHRRLGVLPRGARVFGAYDGAWLFLASHQSRGHQLVNVRTGVVHVLPDVLRVHHHGQLNGYYNMAILAATLSAPPGDRCSVAGAVINIWPGGPDADPATVPHYRHFALWRLDFRGGARVTVNIVAYVEAFRPEDVVYYDGAFHFLIQGGHIRVATPVRVTGGLGAVWETRLFRAGGRSYTQRHAASYLVESRGELLMVARFKADSDHETSAFKVFLAVEPEAEAAGLLPGFVYDLDIDPAVPVDYADNPDPDPNNDDDADNPDPNDDDAVNNPDIEVDPGYADNPNPDGGNGNNASWRWSELHKLEGRMLFIGRGCSRSYEVDKYPGFQEGVYFLDDAKEEYAMMFRDNNEREYSCFDNGRWSPSSHVERCFPAQDPSRYSPAAWLLP